MMSKKYGLIIPGNKKPTTLQQPQANFIRPSIFGSDSDSDEGLPPIKKAPVIGPGVNERRQAKKIQEKALEEDPTVFQYDELYDEIESERNQQKIEKNKDARKPKYIDRLLQCAERRKLENERRLERAIQKERELEGEQFKDKEAFVTSAYRKKLEELRKAEEQEKREEYLESIGDVTKQKNLDGFYRHLYEQKLGNSKDDLIEDKNDTSKVSDNKFKVSNKSRTYRKRRSSNEDDADNVTEKNEIATKRTHLQSNIDADSDFSIDSSSSSSENDEDDESKSKNKNATKTLEENVEIKKERTDESQPSTSKSFTETNNSNREEIKLITENIKKESDESQNDKAPIEDKIEEKPVKINKKDIWKKRTVGEVFEAALKRYYERKAARYGS